MYFTFSALSQLLFEDWDFHLQTC